MSECRTRIISAIAVILALCLLVITTVRPGRVVLPASPEELPSPSSAPSIREELLDCKYYTKSEFELSLTKDQLFSFDSRPAAGVIPHHLIAGEFIASFFAAASAYEYETVLLIGPNHSGENGEMIISESGWNTPYGVLPADQEVNNKLKSAYGLRTVSDNELTENEWSVAALAPYVKYYLPETKVSTVLFSAAADFSQAFVLSELLGNLAKEKDILVVFSVDFSHYLQLDEALLKDAETIAAMESFDYNRLSRMRNEHLDSVPSVMTFLAYAEKRALTPELLAQSSAPEMLRKPGSDVSFRESGITTYMIWGLCE